MLGFGIAGKAFSRILIEKHQEIMEKTGYDVQVTAITTGSRGTLICPQGIDLQEATRQVEELGHFDVRWAVVFRNEHHGGCRKGRL